MSEKTGLEKLRIMLPHWISHNHSHIAEFGKWRRIAAAEAGSRTVDARLAEAVAAMEKAGAALDEVLQELGGPAPGEHHHHHNHH
jgi:hypothetical protein